MLKDRWFQIRIIKVELVLRGHRAEAVEAAVEAAAMMAVEAEMMVAVTISATSLMRAIKVAGILARQLI